MRFFKLATNLFLLLLFSVLYSSFSFAHGYSYVIWGGHLCPTLYEDDDRVMHSFTHQELIPPGNTTKYCFYVHSIPEPEPDDCPAAGPVPNTTLSGHSSPFRFGDPVIIDGCEYSVVSSSGLQIGTGDGTWWGNFSIDSTSRSSDDVIASGDSLPPESNAPSDYIPTPTPRDDNSPSAPSEPVITSESSSSVSNSDGSSTGSGTVSTIEFSDNGSVTDKTTNTVTNTSPTGSVTGTTTTESSTTKNANGSSSTSTTVTETDGNGVSKVVSQSSRSGNEVVDEEGGSISGGKGCSVPPARSGDVSDAEYNQILQTYYLRCPPDSKDLSQYKPDGFDQNDLDSKVSDAQTEYTDFINTIKSEAQSLFNISLGSSGQIAKNVQNIRGAEVDFSLFRFMAELSIIGNLIIALAYIRSFFIITSGEK